MKIIETLKISSIYKSILYILLLIAPSKIWANAAQPGIYSAGGGVFTMLYPEDSVAYKKIQMQQERIYVQLYKGYAVVKGIYIFKNTSKENLAFKMGYPVNGIYENNLGEQRMEVSIDSLSSFKIKSDNEWITIKKENLSQNITNTENIINFGDNWKVWEMDFAPSQVKKVEVYFIVNTNDASLSKGYSSKVHKNVFIYLVESGQVWKQPIEKADFYIQLQDGLSTNDIYGITERFDVAYNEQYKILTASKSAFSPTQEDNLIITYYNRIKDFDFSNAVAKEAHLFALIDNFSNTDQAIAKYATIKFKTPFSQEADGAGTFIFGLMFLGILLPTILFILLAVFIIKRVLKKAPKTD